MGSIADSLDWELRSLKGLSQQWPKQVPLLAELLRPSNIVTAVLVLLVTILAYRRYLSPLSVIPGTFWASVTRLWYVKIIIDGDQNVQLSRLHRKHGHFVRLAPNEVSVTHPGRCEEDPSSAHDKGSEPPRLSRTARFGVSLPQLWDLLC